MLYTALFSWAWLATLLSDNVKDVRRAAGFAVALVLMCFVGLRGHSMDYEGYIEIYDQMVAIDMPYPERLFLGKDPLLSLMIELLIWLRAGPQWMFVLMASLGIAVKQRVFSRAFGDHTAAAWAVTLSLYFFLHEFTQSRAAVAIGMCFIALLAILEGRRLAWFCWAWVGIGFHLSALLFLPLSAALLLPARWRQLGLAAMALSICGIGFLAFDAIMTVDLRISELQDVTGANLTTQLVVATKTLLVLAMAWSLRQHPLNPSLQSMVMPCVWLMIAGVAMLMTYQGISSALAFRLYEFFDAFSVFIVTGALLQRRMWPVLAALAYCALGIALQYLPDLFTRYELAPWARYVGG